MADDEALLAEQQAFYRRRAPEYDEWWRRTGRYDRGPEATAYWRAQVVEIERALEQFDPTGDVLELAGGTGWWTKRLAASAERLTVVDGAPETLELNRARVGELGRAALAKVDYVVADLFSWEPTRRFDVAFFSFWLSHVPAARFDAFWALVGRCLEPSGRAFLIDNRNDPGLTEPDPYVFAAGDGVQRRRLNDGSEHRVVKLFYEPDELTARLAAIGWRAELTGTPDFIFGSVIRSG
jgi:SAM-dependent methyltransferase